jgi:hypothetical protein
VYDIQNEHFDDKQFKPSSTEPIVRVQGMEGEIGSSDEEGSSDDSNLYYEFDSNDESADIKSFTTMSTTQNTKRPLIVDITPAPT